MLMLAEPPHDSAAEGMHPEGARLPQGTRLGARAVLLAMPAELAQRRLAARALPPPCGAVAVSSDAGAHAIVAVADRAAENDAFSLFDEPADRFGIDPIAMAETLDAASRVRLLDFLLGFCRTAFRLSDDAGFAAACLRLARLCAGACGEARAVTRATPGLILLDGVGAEPGDALYLLGPRGVRHSRMAAAATASRWQPIEVPRAGEVLLALGSRPRLWRLDAVPAGLPPLGTLPAPQAGKARAAMVAALHRAAPGSAEAALRREWQFSAPAAPRSLADAASPVGGSLDLALDTGRGVFLRGWLRDPGRLVASLELAGPGGPVPLPPAALHRFHRADVRERFAAATHRDADERTGFVALVNDPRLAGAVQPALRLRLHSGGVAELVPALQTLPPDGARNSVLASVDPEQVDEAMLRDCIAPAAAALHRATQRPCAVAIRRFGRPVARRRVTFAIPLYRELGFLRFQLAALATDPDCAEAEIVFVLDSPEQRDQAEHLLTGLHRLHGIAFTLLLPERNLGFARACNLAAEHATAPAVLLLNSDVVPAAPGWLPPLLAGLQRHVAVGPKLLFDDDSIQHAGLYFERDADGIWFNHHYHKGLPRRWPAAQRARAVPGVTGAALLVERRAFEAVGGVCTDYIIGDYEDSDLCLRLRAADGSIGYVPGAELYHFERRSIALHPGYTRTLACRYNRMLHHARWDAAIAAVMAA